MRNRYVWQVLLATFGTGVLMFLIALGEAAWDKTQEPARALQALPTENHDIPSTGASTSAGESNRTTGFESLPEKCAFYFAQQPPPTLEECAKAPRHEQPCDAARHARSLHPKDHS